jgi:hypothetical protein
MIPAVFVTRRRLLGAMGIIATVPLQAATPGPASSPLIGTFLQPWRAHLDLTPEQWRERLEATRAVGCREIVMQWSALTGGDDIYAFSDTLLRQLLEQCNELKLGLKLGLPYDARFWNVLEDPNPDALPGFLSKVQAECLLAIGNQAWEAFPAFRGWYLPYELEQYSWRDEARLNQLVALLRTLEDAAFQRTHVPLAASTYFSRRPTTNTLETLWGTILDQVKIRPMIQDGVGVSGLSAYYPLAPLRQLLLQRRVPFDLILELFEEVPAAPGATFAAHAADFSRVSTQLRVAEAYGADRIFGFAVDPWIIGPTPEAKLLHDAWLNAFAMAK